MTYPLNILDLFLTLHALRHGAVELNPLMRNIPFQIFYKVVVIGLLCWWLGKREEPIARYGLKLTTLWFGAVNLWHVVNIAAAWLA